MKQLAATAHAQRTSPRRGPFFPAGARRGGPRAAPPFFQARLEIGSPGDPFELEADRVADQVVEGGAPAVQAKCTGCREEAERELEGRLPGDGAPPVRLATRPRIARAPLDLDRLDRELFWGDPLTQRRGGIGFGAARGRRLDPPTEDRRPEMEVEAEVFPRNTASAGGAAATAPGAGGQPGPSGGGRTEGPPADTPRRVVGSGDRSRWGLDPSGLLVPARRALVVGGIHGDERGPLDLMAQLRTELAAGAAPLARDFDTILIPVMNPGGVADRTRTNRRGVDLNRNFPGLQGFPAPAGRVPPQQPEVTAVMDVVGALSPERILALHAIGSAASGGAFADPVEGPARELACRMALRMRGTPLPRGGMSGDVNVRANEVAAGVCSARYPEAASVAVTTAQSSLGAWASAPAAIGGAGGIPVITHEVPEKRPLAATGAGRSVATIMPGIREFLLDNERQPSEADELLRRAVTDAFLLGEATSRAEIGLRDAIVRSVRARFLDLDAHYREVWRPAQPAAARARLPARLTIDSQFRSFRTQAGIAARALGRQPLFRASSTDPEIAQAIRNVMQTISLPGFSRHPWGTEIDVIDATRARWTGSGDLTPVIPFLQAEAPSFGFFHPYTQSPPDLGLPHYEDEPWHLSYWPIANVLQEQWASRITGNVLAGLIARTAAAIGGRVPAARLQAILGGMQLEHFQSNVAPSP